MRRTIKQLYFQNWWWAYGMKTLMAYNANKVFRPSFWLVTSGFVLWIFSDSVPGTPQSQLPSAKQLPFVIQWSQVDMYSVYKLTITCNKLTKIANMLPSVANLLPSTVIHIDRNSHELLIFKLQPEHHGSETEIPQMMMSFYCTMVPKTICNLA